MRSQLVATLGPASLHLAADIVHAGAHALRLNASHMTPPALAQALRALRSTLPAAPVIVDLQGSKMRLGIFDPVAIQPGARLRLGLLPQRGTLPVPHPELFRSVRPGDTLSIDDDRIRLQVTGTDPASATLQASCALGGELRPRKGLNVLEHPVVLDDLLPTDQQHVAVAAALPPVSFAISFMVDGHEADWVRSRAPECPVIGKVERQEAVDRLAQLQACVDEVWLCRGDLGSQLGPERLARWLHAFRPDKTKPVLLAGQVLEHLTGHPNPTRSEVCHLFDILQRGYGGIVLSDETAIGSDPVGAVRTASGLLRAFEA